MKIMGLINIRFYNISNYPAEIICIIRKQLLMKMSARKINTVSENRKKQIITTLSQRFNYDKIINEQSYIKNMSPNMSIKKQILLRDPIFHGIQQKQAETMLKSVPFFQVGLTDITIQYPDASQKVVVTGIKEKVLKQWLEILHKQTKEYRKNTLIKQINLQHWHILEFNNYESASGVKRFLRNKKLERDLESTEFRGMRQKKPNESYKFQFRRVRIVLLNEDFFTILVDQINESLNEEFLLSIESNTMRNEVRVFKNLIYLSVSASPTSEQRQQDVEEQYSSQLNSQTSSIRDNRMNQIDVQTSNIGTQIQIQTPILIQSEKQNPKQIQEKNKQKQIERGIQRQKDDKSSEVISLKGTQKWDTLLKPQNQINYQRGYEQNKNSNSQAERLQERKLKNCENYELRENQNGKAADKDIKLQSIANKNEINKQNLQISHQLQQRRTQNILAQESKNGMNGYQIKSIQRIQEDFPQLTTQKQESKTQKKQQHQNYHYICLSYNQIMRKYKKYVQQNENREYEFVTIPSYIKKQPDTIKSKKMFHEGVIKQGQKLLHKREQQQY